jgi:hypothetical protein
MTGPVQAQAPDAAATSVIPWFAVHNKSLVVQTGNKTKPLTKDVALLNGIRLEHLSRTVILTNGTRVQMHEGDLLSLNGEFIRRAQVAAPAPAPPAPAVVAAPAPVVVLVAAPAAPAPAPKPATFTFQPAAPVGGTLKGVSGRDIHFVVSSGDATADVTRRIVQELEGLKYKVNTVTPEREGALGLRAALPTAFADKAFVLDIGSANSKISWLERGQPITLDTHGSKYYEKGLNDAIMASEVKAKASQVPAKLRGTCFIIGGAPYELAKAVRQGQESFTVLGVPAAYTQLSGAKAKAGLNIYQAVAEATGCQQFVFG